MTNSPIFSKLKKTKPKNRLKKPLQKSKSTETISWFNRFSYPDLLKKNGLLFWQNWKKLLPLCLLLLLTGGQAISQNFSFNGNWSPTNQTSNNNSTQTNPTQQNSGNWMETLKNIEDQENQKIQIQNFIEKNKDKKNYFIYGGLSLALIIIIGVIALFCLNSYFHLLLINQLRDLFHNHKRSRLLLKENARKKWRNLVWLRIIFGLVYLISFLLFLSPAGIFALQKSWIMAGTLSALGLLTSAVAFFIIGYVFRYSLFYFALTGISLRSATDKGYDLFINHWKESLLASFVNFVLQIIFWIFLALATILFSLVYLLIGGIFWLLLYFVLGQTHPWEIAIGLGILALLILLSFMAVFFSLWGGYIIAFWLSIFEELAGCKKALLKTFPNVVKILEEAHKGATHTGIDNSDTISQLDQGKKSQPNDSEK